MKLVSVDAAKATWLFPLNEWNPTGRSFSLIFVELTKRYVFKKAPSHDMDYDPEAKGLIFNQGEFTNRNGNAVNVKLSLFPDGVVAETWSSTTDSEDFLRDAMNWIRTEHGISLPTDRLVTTLYLSQLTVSMERKHGLVVSKLQALSDIVSRKMAESGRTNKGFVTGGFSLWATNWDENLAPAPYRFELKSGSKPGENRYFAAAPLPTDSHIEVLEEQERLLL